MNWFLLLFILFFIEKVVVESFVVNYVDNLDSHVKNYECTTEYKFSKKCYFYKFQNNCVPWNLDACEPFKVKKNEPKCPKYNCIVQVRNCK